jgi:Skp family chaperone for outer membrane proteins
MAFLSFMSAQAYAETPVDAAPPPLIAVVDVQRIVHESHAGKSLDAQYDQQHQLFTDQVAAKERELDNREEELKRQRTVLTPDSFNAQREALETYAAQAQKTIQDQSQANQLAFNDAFAQLVKTVREIVSAVAKEKNVAVVLPQEQTLYIGDGTIDITEMVLNRLEARLPQVTVVLPSAGAATPGKATP